MKTFFNFSKKGQTGTIIKLLIFLSIIILIIRNFYFGYNYDKEEITYEEFSKDLGKEYFDNVIIYDKEYLVYKSKENNKTKLLFLDEFLVDKIKFEQSTVKFKIRHKERFSILKFLNIVVYIVYYFMIFLVFINIIHFFKKNIGEDQSINKDMIKDAIEAKINNNTTLKSVGGLFEIKKEVLEFSEITLNPSKYIEMGAKIPKGLLMTGPPGTGKTMLAKAIAKEYDTPFFYISGSDFSKPIVGMGTIFVKSIFNTARKFKPCIIFIDEIDSIGSKRSSSANSGHLEEKNSILNALLTEIDGFKENNSGIIIMAATNRIDTLDPALLRAGRFDRIVDFKTPTYDERKDIIQIYIDKIKINSKEKNKLVEYILNETPGFTGAQIYNIINESCIYAAKNNLNNVSFESIITSIDYVLYGYSKPISILSNKELMTVAYHEAGHTLISLVCKDIQDAVKLTIIPRSKGALGFTKLKPEENRNLYSKKELICKILLGMGGRAAEEYKFGNYEITTGASHDLESLNSIAKELVIYYGMDSEIGLLQKKDRDINTFILERVQKIINNLYKVCLYIIEDYSNLLEELTKRVLKKETIIIKEEKLSYKVIPNIEKYIDKVLN